jgi:nucleoside-diphosphate-sugar epimerase
MRTVIAGGHGQIALRLARVLQARGDQPVGLIRRAEQADEVRAAGAEPWLIDLEAARVGEAAEALKGADAVVFAAGAGPGSGTARKDSVDRAAAELLADAAEAAGVRRYLMISSMGADANSQFDGDPVFRAYLRAKGAADDYVRPSSAGPCCAPAACATIPASAGCCSPSAPDAARSRATTWRPCWPSCWSAPERSASRWS